MAWPETTKVLDADGVERELPTPNANSRAAADDSRPVAVDQETFDSLEATRIAAEASAAAASSTSPVPTFMPTLRPSASFTRPSDTTAYAAGDLVANSTTAGSVAAMAFTVANSSGGKGLIRAVKIKKGGTATASLRAHFFTSAPTLTNGDNGAFLPTESGYLGYIDVSLAAFSDGASGVGLGELYFDLTGTTDVYGVLETRGAFTPSSASIYTVEVTSWPEV